MLVDHERLHSLFRKLGRQLVKVSSKPLPKNVHQFRTATRRIEAVVGELVPKPDRNQRKLLKQLSRLRRRAGRLRDIDVQVAALRTLKLPEEPRRKTQILHALSEARARREKKLLKSFNPGAVPEIRKRLRRAEADLAKMTTGIDPLAIADRLFAALDHRSGPLTEERLHQYRIHGKRIRYVAELAQDSPASKHMIAQLKRMQDALGDWHDWLTLTETVRQLGGGQPNSPLLSALNNITRAKFRDAVHLVEETKAALAKPVAAPDRDSMASPARRRRPHAALIPAAAAA
jgi:CHAD domain-containing protein